MNAKIVLMLLVLASMAATHVWALIASRRGASARHRLAFFAGTSGLVVLAAALVAMLFYMPFLITGPGNHPIAWILPTTLIIAMALPLVSLATVWTVRKPS